MDKFEDQTSGNQNASERSTDASNSKSENQLPNTTKKVIKVLLVDDEKDSYLHIKMVLDKKLGRECVFEVDWVDNHRKAMEVLFTKHYDVCIIDYFLMEVNGVQLMREMIANGYKNPIILLTTGAGSEVEKNAIRMGAADYIVKREITPDYLQRSILYTIDRRALEAELSELKERDKSPNGKLIVDEDGIIQYVNNSAEVFLGATASQLLGRPYAHPYATDQNDEIRILDNEGKPGTAETSVVEITYRNKPAQLISLVDITEHKRLRDQLKSSNNLLEKSNKSLEQFAHIVSHDFKSPLGNLKMLLEMFDWDEKELDHNRKVFDGIRTGVDQIEGSFSGLLDTLNIYYGYKMKKKEIDIEKTYLDIKESIQEVITASDTELQTNFKHKKIFYNPAHFKSIMLNLISNAIKFKSPERSPRIFLETWKVNGSVQMSIRDNGLGIDLNRHGKDIFGSFKRFHKDVEGTGIGLYNTKSILESHGGQIEVKSEKDVGTTFNIHF